MEALLTFLYSASISISSFFILYWILLRKLTNFRANRFFLLAALVVSVFIAAFPIHYKVVTPMPGPLDLNALPRGTESGRMMERIPGINDRSLSSPTMILVIMYCAGIFVFLLRLMIQTWKSLQIIHRSKSKKSGNCYIHQNTDYALPFSFFNHIFINPGFHKQDDLDDILAHEKVHIRERHWIDLIFIELLTVLFWFNPFIWFFEHAIKQNHEFLADEGVLLQGRSPVRYQALLVNQLMGMQVTGLTNRLTFALVPNRLNMMTKQKTPKRKLLRMSWGIPVLAVLLTAFAEPEYQSATPPGVQTNAAFITTLQGVNKTTISGKVVNGSGNPLNGATIIIRGTTTGTVAGENGSFSLEVPESETVEIVISYVGFRSIAARINPKKDFQWNFTMEREVVGIDTRSMLLEKEMPSPPPPPVPVKEPVISPGEEVFFIVEEMPQYPGGHYGLGQYVREKQEELKADGPNKLQGKATTAFTINEKGEVSNIRILDKTTDEAAKALTTIVAGMSNWSPGKQRGKAVPVDYAMQLEF